MDAVKNLTFDQIRAPVERVVYITLGYLAARYPQYLGSADVTAFGTAIVALIAAFYGYWINRPKSLLQSVSALPEVKKIETTNTALAADPTLPKVTEAPQ